MTSARLRLLLLGVLVTAILLAWAFLPIGAYLEAFNRWLQGLGLWGLVLLAVAYTPASLLLFPGSVLTLGAGAAFGFLPALVAISLGSTTAAGVAFLVARYLGRDWIEQKVAQHPRFQALDQAVGAQGFRIVLLTRLSPAFPFTLLNYAYGLTKISFRSYLLASWLGMLPGTVLYVYLGRAARGMFAVLDDVIHGRPLENPGQTLLMCIGLLATIAVTVSITRLARRALNTALSAPHH